MTAETLKSFIALPASGSTYNKSKRNANLITICISTIFSLVCVFLLGFLIFNCVRVHQLEQEVESLKKSIDGMQKRLGLDYLDDLNEFEEAYSNDLLEYDQLGELLPSVEGEEDDEFDDEEESSGSYEFDDENYDDNDADTDVSDDNHNISDDVMNFFKFNNRKQRSISTQIGNPDPMSSIHGIKDTPRNPSNFKILKQLPDEFDKTMNIDDEDEVEKIETRHKDRKRNRHAHPNLHRRAHYGHHDFVIHKPGGRYIVKRRSGNNRLLKSGASPKYEEHRPEVQQSHFSALHYILNGTLSNHEHHPRHEGNPRLLHDGDVYVGHAHPWVKGLAMDKSVVVENGILKIPESGIYLIYAQVFYQNHMDRNGFFVYHNSHPFLQCALTVPTNSLKGNTCYTSGVTLLEKDDTIHLRDLFKDRGVTLRGPKSFFGIIKLSDTNRH